MRIRRSAARLLPSFVNGNEPFQTSGRRDARRVGHSPRTVRPGYRIYVCPTAGALQTRFSRKQLRADRLAPLGVRTAVREREWWWAQVVAGCPCAFQEDTGVSFDEPDTKGANEYCRLTEERRHV